ncbi:MAG: 1-acyl-sn-glycerol-3-phosphate acyltransferase [Clostridiales bacterium]|nr:1-acyl-sn-glycerol-3-phosphate acyltransferase [Clostridiales bacterium]
MRDKSQRLRGLQEFSYRAARLLAGPYFTWRFGAWIDQQPDLAPPYVVVANHVTELDFYFTGMLFRTPMGFVVGRGLLQNPWLNRLLVTGFGCIGKQKGATDAQTTLSMLRRLRQGRNVCLFVEGNTTFDGRTGPFNQASGGVLKAMGAGLVTCRIEGGYFALPRWGRGIRRGRTAIRVVNTYSKEQLAGMTSEALNRQLAQDLFEDAYARQQAAPVAYRGKRKAEGLEHALYQCPVCQGFNSLRGSGDSLECLECGTTALYTEFGMLEGGFPLTSILEWTTWQKEQMAARFRDDPAQTLAQDPGQQLFIQQEDGSLRLLDEGVMRMSGLALTLGSFETPLEKISGLEIYRKNILQFTLRDGRHLQTGSLPGFNALKYRDLYDITKGKDV